MLQALAKLLDAASDRIGARIWMLSDEPYRRIRVGDVTFVSPAAVYPWTLIDCSYGKVLLAPGQRLGYLAISPLLPTDVRTELRDATFPAQMSLGWTFPDALMQHSVPQLERVSMDLAALAVKRDRMLGSLQQWGYRMIRPEGTFYLWGEAPGGDALQFADRLAERAVRHARHAPRGAATFPDQPDGKPRDGRPRSADLPRRCSGKGMSGRGGTNGGPARPTTDDTATFVECADTAFRICVSSRPLGRTTARGFD